MNLGMQVAIFLSVVLIPALIGGQTRDQSRTPKCADLLISAYDCLERVKTSDISRMLQKKKEEIIEKCVPDLPE